MRNRRAESSCGRVAARYPFGDEPAQSSVTRLYKSWKDRETSRAENRTPLSICRPSKLNARLPFLIGRILIVGHLGFLAQGRAKPYKFRAASPKKRDQLRVFEGHPI